MAHFISALIAKLPIDSEQAELLDLPVFIKGQFAIVGLDANHSDYWAAKLGIPADPLSGMAHDRTVTLEFVRRLAISRFALIETEYFGGIGEQFATVYDGGERVLDVREGGINAALRRIGVVACDGKDEFDTIGLGAHRSFQDEFVKYYEGL